MGFLLRYAYRAGFARPNVDILKQVMMDGAIMPKIKLALGQGLPRSCIGDFRIVSVQFVLVAQIELIYENR